MSSGLLRTAAVLLLAAGTAGCSPRPQPAADTGEPAASPPGAVEDAATPAAASESTPERLVRQMADFYRSKETIQVVDRVTTRNVWAGLQQEADARRSIAFARPNPLAIRRLDEAGGMEIFSDGNRLITYMPLLQSYTETAAPATCDELLRQPIPATRGGGGVFVLSLISDDPYARIMEGVASGEYVGLEPLDGRETHRLRFTQEQMDWELWIDAGPEPLVRQVSVDMSRGFGDVLQQIGQEALGELSVTITERFEGWKFDEPLDPATFAFEPPPDALRQEDLFDTITSPDQEQPLPPLPDPQ